MSHSSTQRFDYFASERRSCGILLHVTSLPTPFGIGDMGPAAERWVDRLASAGQSWWQILPLGPTGVGNSPYEPLSTFAGNLLLLSPERLTEDGLVDAGEWQHVSMPDGPVQFDQVREFKLHIFQLAWEKFQQQPSEALARDFAAFSETHNFWLQDYSLFRALKDRFGAASYLTWPHEILTRDPGAIAQAAAELSANMNRHRFGQFLFFRQWTRLRQYAADRKVRLIGDLPFFVSPDSSDVWANPQLFLLGEDRRPRFIAGVPPDYFSAFGQLWGNPIYDWEALRGTGYRWWIERLKSLLEHVDLVRLDHFRAFESAWHVEAGAPTAQVGEWRPGPGADLFECLRRELGGLPFVAEDLGMITDEVRSLRDQFHLPGMRVLQFAFDGDPTNPFLPHNYDTNCLACTGTHDNNTTRGWYENLSEHERENVWRSLETNELPADQVAPDFLRRVWQSAASVTIAPFQDIANLSTDARMNVPGQAEGNWNWRIPADHSCDGCFDELRRLTESSRRIAQ